jgi:hypothetical protein
MPPMAREKGSKNKSKVVDDGKHSKNIGNYEKQLAKYGSSKLREFIQSSPEYGDADNEEQIIILEELKSLLDENKSILLPSKNNVDEIMLLLGADDEENNNQVYLLFSKMFWKHTEFIIINDLIDKQKRLIRALADRHPLVEERQDESGAIIAGQPDEFKITDFDLEVQITFYEQRLTALKYEQLRRISADYRITLEIMIEVMTPANKRVRDTTCDYQSQEY